METKETPKLEAAVTEIDQFLKSVPSTDAICERIDQLDRERQSLKQLLRIAHANSSRREVRPCT